MGSPKNEETIHTHTTTPPLGLKAIQTTMNSTAYPPKTPPRRAIRSRRFTPSNTPYITPRSKTKTPGLPRSNRPTPYRLSRTPYREASPLQKAISTPNTPPVSSSSDRFIPSRSSTNHLEMCRRALLSDTKRSLSESSKEDEEDNKDEDNPLQKEHKRRMLSTMCDIPLENLNEDGEPAGIFSFGRKRNQVNQVPDIMNPFHHDVLRSLKIGGVELDAAAHRDVAKKALRKVPSAPTRILDAPDIVDDYYLNLISWSKDNILAVALAQAVYLWNAGTGAIQHLVTVGEDGSSDYVTSVNWCAVPDQTHFIGVGTNSGKVMIYDGPECRLVRTMRGHRGRVSSLHWNTHILSSGARDSKIINHDVRVASHIVSVFRGHEQEVCGLRWNEDGTTLASGGNENYLCLWDANMSQSSSGGSSQHTPRLILKQHKAAVKALDWCPFHRGLLASGGGTADRCVKFWNTSSGALLNSIDTGSQVCSIVWSRHQRELCTSHGYSENQLILWKYPSMTKIKELKGHSNRVLNMEMSPDGASVVSAAADETLRFWNVFGNAKITGGSSLLGGSDLSFLTPIR